MWPLLIPAVIVAIYIAIIIFHKDIPSECRYLEVSWEYPVPENTPLMYNFNFTNKPWCPDRSCGNMGLAYECFDLYNYDDIKRLKKLNDGYKKNNYGCPYISEEVIQTAIENFENFEKASCEY